MLIKVIDVIGKDICVSSEDGEKLHEQIKLSLQKDDTTEISFSGIKMIISVFLNTAIGQLYGEFSEDEIRKKLKVNDIEQEDVELLGRVVTNAKRYYKNSKEYDKAWEDSNNG